MVIDINGMSHRGKGQAGAGQYDHSTGAKHADDDISAPAEWRPESAGRQVGPFSWEHPETMIRDLGDGMMLEFPDGRRLYGIERDDGMHLILEDEHGGILYTEDFGDYHYRTPAFREAMLRRTITRIAGIREGPDGTTGDDRSRTFPDGREATILDTADGFDMLLTGPDGHELYHRHVRRADYAREGNYMRARREALDRLERLDTPERIRQAAVMEKWRREHPHVPDATTAAGKARQRDYMRESRRRRRAADPNDRYAYDCSVCGRPVMKERGVRGMCDTCYRRWRMENEPGYREYRYAHANPPHGRGKGNRRNGKGD